MVKIEGPGMYRLCFCHLHKVCVSQLFRTSPLNEILFSEFKSFKSKYLSHSRLEHKLKTHCKIQKIERRGNQLCILSVFTLVLKLLQLLLKVCCFSVTVHKILHTRAARLIKMKSQSRLGKSCNCHAHLFSEARFCDPQ